MQVVEENGNINTSPQPTQTDTHAHKYVHTLTCKFYMHIINKHRDMHTNVITHTYAQIHTDTKPLGQKG